MTDFVPQFELAGNFTTIPNHCLRDPRLSDKAKGRLAYLASHKVGYRLTITQQVAETKGGRDSVYAALKELIEFDYLKRTQARGEDGKLGPVVYEWGSAAVEQQYERAWGESSQVKPASGKAVTGESGSGQSVSGRSAAKKNNPLEEQPKEDQLNPPPGTVGAERTVRNARGRTSAAPPRNEDSSPPTTSRRKPSRRSREGPSQEAWAALAGMPRPWLECPLWVRKLLAGRIDKAMAAHGYGAQAIASAVTRYAPAPESTAAVTVGGAEADPKTRHLDALERVLWLLAGDVKGGSCRLCGDDRVDEVGVHRCGGPGPLVLIPGVCASCERPDVEATARPEAGGMFACDGCWAAVTAIVTPAGVDHAA